MSNRLKVVQQNNLPFVCDVSGFLNDLDGFTPWFTAKETKDGSIVIEKEGSIEGLRILFELDYTDTSIAPKTYSYDISIESSTAKYTPVMDAIEIVAGVRY
jgi:hypothetical protein